MSHTPEHTDPNDSIARRHETSDADFKKVFVTGLVLLGVMGLGFLLSWGVYSVWSRYTAAPSTHAETLTKPDLTQQPAGPKIQADPHAALIALRKSEDSVLTSYGWSNKDSGIARVPIDRAMEMLAKKGLPNREARDQTNAE